MQTRKFGNIFDVSAMSLGAMRLPMINNAVDEKKAVEMIRYCIDNGVNYIDTAYPYHNGESEKIVGKALSGGYRNKTMLATKLPLFGQIKSAEDFDKLLNEQLKKLQTDRVDFYLFHGLNRYNWNNLILKFNLIEKMEKAIKDGRVLHAGFSFHDDYEAFVKIVDGYNKWEFCQLQYNYMDTTMEKSLEYAYSKNIPVIVMEPVFGGKLANPPENVKNIFDNYPVKHTPAEWALDFVWNRKEAATLLTGVSSLEQAKENVKYAQKAEVNALTEIDLKMLNEVKAAYKKIRPVPCTNCGYCMPCPHGVDIPANFNIYNDTYAYGLEQAKGGYMWIRGKRAELCAACGECEAKCPQKIEISKLMPKVHDRLK